MWLFSLYFLVRRYRRYRALFWVDKRFTGLLNICFCLRFSNAVIDVIDVIGTFAFGIGVGRVERFGGQRRS